MATRTIERNFSELLRQSGDVLADVEAHDVLLRRRDGADLVLTRADREGKQRALLALSASVTSALARSHRDLVADSVVSAMPWAAALPAGDRADFAEEFVATLAAASDLGAFEQLSITVQQWRNTAFVHANAAMAKRFKTDLADNGFDEPVPVPDVEPPSATRTAREA